MKEITHFRDEGKKSYLIPLTEGMFRFACHPAVPCFTTCCRELRLVLTPYDIIRLKNRLGLSAGEFLKTYTLSEAAGAAAIPLVFLKMRNDGGKTCPFVTPRGCAVYEDRPGACRLYPLGRAAQKEGGGKARERYFLIREPECQGFKEENHWTVAEWLAHEELDRYNDFNDSWTAIITSRKLLQKQSIHEKSARMLYLASYNVDLFRRLVCSAQFLTRFQVDEALVNRLQEDDVEMLKFALRWLRFSLLGEGGMVMKKEAQPVPRGSVRNDA